jgi:hypothetical protein
VETETAAAVAQLRRRYAMLRQVRDRVLDQAEESLRISLAAYKEGGTIGSRTIRPDSTFFAGEGALVSG